LEISVYRRSKEVGGLCLGKWRFIVDGAHKENISKRSPSHGIHKQNADSPWKNIVIPRSEIGAKC